jgi:hypothetical protein
MLRLFKNDIAKNQKGSINTLFIPLVLAVLFLCGAVGFGYWAYMSRQGYKDNSDQKVAAAVSVAKQQQVSADAASYAQTAKKPLLTYVGPPTYGSLNVQYPKTWSAYVAVAAATGDSTPLNAYFQPGVVPNIEDPASLYALRVEVLQTPYSQILTNFNTLAQQNSVTVSAYSLPKVPSVVGVLVNGEIEPSKQGSMVILPLRDTTLEIWTESVGEEGDFNTYVLPNFSFSP